MSSTTGVCQECLEEETQEFCPEVFERAAKEEAELRSFLATVMASTPGEEGPLRRLKSSPQLGASVDQQPQPDDRHLRDWDFGHHILDELMSKHEGLCEQHRAAAVARDCGYRSGDGKEGKVLTWDDVDDVPLAKLPPLFQFIGDQARVTAAAAAAASAAVKAMVGTKRKAPQTLGDAAAGDRPTSPKASGSVGPAPDLEESDPIECNSPLAPSRQRFARAKILTSRIGKVRRHAAAHARASGRDQKKSFIKSTKQNKFVEGSGKVQEKKHEKDVKQHKISEYLDAGKDDKRGKASDTAIADENQAPRRIKGIVEKAHVLLRLSQGRRLGRPSAIPEEEKLVLAHCWGCCACWCKSADEDDFLGKQRITHYPEHLEFKCYHCCANFMPSEP